MICILRVVEGPAKGMKCWLRRDQRLTIGRQSSTDFSIPADLHMSRNHVLVEGLSSSFRIRDLGSSNGTYVNNVPISTIELCHGDLIKAGSSVFSVDIQDDETTPVKESIVFEDDSVGFIPNRTLSADDLSSDQDTMRFTLESLEPASERKDESQAAGGIAPVAPQSAKAGWIPEPAVERPSLEPSAAQQPASSESRDRGTSESVNFESGIALPSAFLAGFARSEKNRLLWRQTAEAAMWEPIRLIDCLIAAPSRLYLNLIINRSQLDAAQFATYDFGTAASNYRALSETLHILQSPHYEAVLKFYKACLTKDAAVCIASMKPLSDHWLHDAIDVLSYPSMLFEQLSVSPARAAELVSKVQFVMFEPNTQGELALLHAGD